MALNSSITRMDFDATLARSNANTTDAPDFSASAILLAAYDIHVISKYQARNYIMEETDDQASARKKKHTIDKTRLAPIATKKTQQLVRSAARKTTHKRQGLAATRWKEAKKFGLRLC